MGPNNTGEVTAIIEALLYAHQQGWQHLTIHSDSQWAINTITGRWRSKCHHDLVQLAKQLTKLVKTTFSRLNAMQVKRETKEQINLRIKANRPQPERAQRPCFQFWANNTQLHHSHPWLHIFRKQQSKPSLLKPAPDSSLGSRNTHLSYSHGPEQQRQLRSQAEKKSGQAQCQKR